MRTALCCLLAAVWAIPATAQSRPVRSDQDVLMQLERDWDAAFRRNDAAFIDTILAEEFIVTYDDGTRGDRAKELALAVSFNQKLDSSTLDEFIVKENGDTAIVWPGEKPSLRFHSVGSTGLPRTLRGARWQCVSSQSTRVVTP